VALYSNPLPRRSSKRSEVDTAAPISQLNHGSCQPCTTSSSGTCLGVPGSGGVSGGHGTVLEPSGRFAEAGCTSGFVPTMSPNFQSGYALVMELVVKPLHWKSGANTWRLVVRATSRRATIAEPGVQMVGQAISLLHPTLFHRLWKPVRIPAPGHHHLLPAKY
jgi:hypothetical protein